MYSLIGKRSIFKLNIGRFDFLKGEHDMLKAIIGFVVGAVAVYLLVSPSGDIGEASNLSDSPLFQENLAIVKAFQGALVNEDIETLATMMSDTVRYNSPAYGSTVGTKEDWIGFLQEWFDNFEDFAIEQVVFLPGLDGVTAEPDGSVRFYIHWNNVHSSGVKVDPWYYASFDLEGGKIVAAEIFGDVGGMMNHIAQVAATSESE